MHKRSLLERFQGLFVRKLTKEELLAAEVSKLEVQLGIPLPNQFKQFLLRNEGQHPYLDTCKVYGDISESQELYSFSIRKFLQIKDNQKDDFLYNYNKYKAETPLPNLLPIAFDQFRNIMLISLTDGRIYFWDKESRVNEKDIDPGIIKGDRLYYVAPDFNTFEERLYRHQRFN